MVKFSIYLNRRVFVMCPPKDALDPWLPTKCPPENSDLAAQMRWLIWVFSGRTYNLVGNAVSRLVCIVSCTHCSSKELLSEWAGRRFGPITVLTSHIPTDLLAEIFANRRYILVLIQNDGDKTYKIFMITVPTLRKFSSVISINKVTGLFRCSVNTN